MSALRTLEYVHPFGKSDVVVAIGIASAATHSFGYHSQSPLSVLKPDVDRQPGASLL